MRRAGVEDTESIVAILKFAPFLNEQYRSEEARRRISQECKNGLFWVAESRGEVASAMMTMRSDVFPYGRKCIEIRLIVTKPEHRRRGLARRLLRKAKDLATAENADITAYAENEKSTALLKCEGFSVVPGCINEQGHPKYELVNFAN